MRSASALCEDNWLIVFTECRILMVGEIMIFKNKGSVIVEFALVLPFFAYLFLALIYIGLWMHDVNAVNEVARIGVRQASFLSGADLDTAKANIGSLAKNMLVIYSGTVVVESNEPDGYMEIKIIGTPTQDTLNSIVGAIIPDTVVGNAVMAKE